jgi:hypothetical protein
MINQFQNLEQAKNGLNKANKTINSGFIGWLTRLFMGKSFTEQMNQSINVGKEAIKMVEKRNLLMQTGTQATATVLEISDTGKLVNFDPIVILKLKISNQNGMEYEITSEQIVSKLSIPRIGDKIFIKYNPKNSNEFVVL